MTDIILLGIGILFFIGLLYFVFGFKPKENEEERKIRESLKDEFIYDPETGVKITLEQATSGQWVAHTNGERIKTKEELEQFYRKDEVEVEEIANHMKLSGYKSVGLSDSQIGILKKTQVLGKYDDWSYSHSFSFNDSRDYVFFPAVEWKGKRYAEDYYGESQLLFWVQIENSTGHYYLRGKTGVESFLDMFRKDDDLKLQGYESFTLEKSNTIISINRLLEKLKGVEGLEIEIIRQHLFVKTTCLICKEDFFRLEKILGIGSGNK